MPFKKEGNQSKERIRKLEISIQSTPEASGQRGQHHQNRERIVSKQRGEKSPTTQDNPRRRREKIEGEFDRLFQTPFQRLFREKSSFSDFDMEKNRFRHEERILLFSFLVFSF